MAKLNSLEEDILFMKEHNFDLDCKFKVLTKEYVEKCHANGIKVNAWTVNEVEDGYRLINEIGVDFITTNILE